MTNIQENVKQGYIDWLGSMKWDYWFTGTTRYELSTKSARRLSERYFDAIRSPGDNSRMFYVTEPNDLRDGHHIHALIKLFYPLSYAQMYDLWQWATGTPIVDTTGNSIQWEKSNWNRVQAEKYNPARGAAGYCSKYIMKNHADYDILI